DFGGRRRYRSPPGSGNLVIPLGRAVGTRCRDKLPGLYLAGPIKKPVVRSTRDGLRTTSCAQLAGRVVDMKCYSSDGPREPMGNLLGGEAAGAPLQALPLAFRQLDVLTGLRAIIQCRVYCFVEEASKQSRFAQTAVCAGLEVALGIIPDRG